ncbi:MAG: hypothetical protein JXA54_07855 [Candidatus Heimdallarchaeota archaeon]|nr:hypothetical protein [Candidatus Heimdallarchaeota archaeon]
MRLNKLVVTLALILMVTPILASVGSTNITKPTYDAKNYGDTVLVEAGTTIKYTINTLTLPTIPNVTITGLSGNQLYVKVMAVQDDFEFDPLISGNLIWYGLGIILTKDVSVTIGEGFTAIDLILPTGAATPAIVQSGIPHFNASFYQPALFFLDNNWVEHNLFLSGLGFTTTNGADSLSASYINGTSGSVSMTWRKSDGILTAMHIENMIVFGMDYRGITFDISITSTVVNGISVTVGQEIILNADISYINIEGSGEYYSMLNQSAVISIEEEAASLKGQTMLKYVITHVEGLYYTATVYSYDMTTDSLVTMGDYLFCGFLGEIQMVEPPLIDFTSNYMDVYAPVITKDYDIYGGYMTLMDTMVGVYLDEILSLVMATSGDVVVNSIDGSFGILEKRGYFFLQETLDVEITGNVVLTYTEPLLPSYSPQSDPSLIVHAVINQEGWVAYSSDGIIAGMRTTLNIAVDFTTNYETYSIAAGTMSIVVDFKLRNPEYNPPDPLGGGLIPGFTWLISIPALFSIAVIGIVKRKK